MHKYERILIPSNQGTPFRNKIGRKTMKNMKKILCLALAMLMCAMCFVGCGKTEADNTTAASDDTNVSTEDTTTASEETEAPEVKKPLTMAPNAEFPP